jgi:hypothetical protein
VTVEPPTAALHDKSSSVVLAVAESVGIVIFENAKNPGFTPKFVEVPLTGAIFGITPHKP